MKLTYRYRDSTMTALLDDAAERHIAEILHKWCTVMQGQPLEDCLRMVWTEATEAAALKCEAIHDAGLRSHLDYYDACKRCAAAIRGGKL